MAESIQTIADYSRFLASRKWDAMFTATFAQKQFYPHTAIDLVAHKMPDVRKMFVAAELHKLGGYHCHGLVEFNNRKAVDNERLFRMELDIARVHLSRSGFANVSPCRDSQAVSAYCVKYLTKDLADYEMFGSRLAWVY